MNQVQWFLSRVAPPLLMLVLILVLWELVIWIFDPPDYLICGPMDVFKAMADQFKILMQALWITLQAVLLGFFFSLISGLLLALVMDQFRWFERSFYPYTVFLQTVPLVAIAPALVVWMDYGLWSVVVCVWVVSVFPMITSSLSGLKSTEQAKVELFKLYGAGWWARLLKLRLPSALPGVFAGMKIAAGLAVIGAVVAEFLVGRFGNERGLGTIIAMTGAGNIALMFAAVLLASAIGLLMLFALNAAGWLMMRHWHDAYLRDEAS